MEPGFGESSWPLFSMYSKMAMEEDDKTTERWQKDADGILIFVRPHNNVYPVLYRASTLIP